jgi:dolichol-phosphate mannosyltransferase
MGTRVSVLMPAYNEAENLVELVPQVAAVLDRAGESYEIVVVDDGSTDGTRSAMQPLRSANVRYIRLRRNAGKSAALSLGLEHVRGEYVVLMDADGQDDPEELPRLLQHLEAEGLDCVTGRRAVRNDRFIKRTTSKVYNGVTAKVTGVPGKDFNSGLKAMTRELAESLEMYGELHRYIPVLAVWNGFRVGELDVEHHERRHGSSKFGRARFWRGFLDLVTVKFLTTYTARPFHLFGGIGFVIGLVGSLLLAWMGVSKAMGHDIGTRPALQLGVLLVVVAVQMLSLGLLGELMVNLRRRRNLDATAEGDLQ